MAPQGARALVKVEPWFVGLATKGSISNEIGALSSPLLRGARDRAGAKEECDERQEERKDLHVVGNFEGRQVGLMERGQSGRE